MIKKLTQHLKQLLRPKQHPSTRRHGRINTNGWGLTEKKTKLMFCEFYREYSRGSKQIISKQTAWKHISWGQWRTCFDQRPRKWNFFLTQHNMFKTSVNFFLPTVVLIAKKEWFVPWKHMHTCTCRVYTLYIYYGWWSNRYSKNPHIYKNLEFWSSG